MRARLVIAGLVIGSLTACFPFNPFAHEFTTREPKKDEVVGTYVLSHQTVQNYAPTLANDLKGLPEQPSIVIASDGKFSFHRVPTFGDEKSPMNPRFTGFSDASGTWAIATVGGVGDGSGKVESHWGLRLSTLSGSMGSPGFMGKSKPDRLIFTFSDPDSGEVLIFRKK